MIVDLFIPCFIDQLSPETGFNMIKILEKLGLGVHYNPEQTCCGQVAFNNGYWDEAKAVGEKFIKDFPNDRPIIGPSASCVGYIRNFYPKLFHNTALHNEYKQLRKNIYEFSDFLVNVMKVKDVGARFEGIVTYHDSCSALREYGIKNEPRILLNHVKGLSLVEMEETHTCCGFGGTFAMKFEPVSTAMAQAKVDFALKTGAQYIVSTDTSCLINQDAYIRKNNLPIKVMHLADILASGW